MNLLSMFSKRYLQSVINTIQLCNMKFFYILNLMKNKLLREESLGYYFKFCLKNLGFIFGFIYNIFVLDLKEVV